MRGLFARKGSVFKWMSLLMGTVAVAIALASSLDSAPYRFPSAVESPSTEVQTLASEPFDPQDFTVLERYDRRWIHYATVSRSDRSFREMFVAAEDASRIQAGQPLPDNTLILMETWYSPESLGTVFIKQKLDGTWHYGSFSPTRPDYYVSNLHSCHRCHAPFPETDFTLTKPLLEAALQVRALQTAYCDRPGRTPCAPEAYLPDAR